MEPRWHCVRYVMAITKKRFSFPNCAKRTGAFLTAPALAGISSDLMQSQEATDDCRRRPIGLCAAAISMRFHRTVLRERDATAGSLQAPSMRSLWRAFRHGDASWVGK